MAQIDGRSTNELLGADRIQSVALPSAELDGCLVACGFFVYAMVEQGFNLPHAIEKYRLGKVPQTPSGLTLDMTYVGTTELGHRFDFVLVDGDGNVVLEVTGYETVVIRE